MLQGVLQKNLKTFLAHPEIWKHLTYSVVVPRKWDGWEVDTLFGVLTPTINGHYRQTYMVKSQFTRTFLTSVLLYKFCT